MLTSIYENPVELLRTLIRFNTTNPPGNEAECIGYLAGLLREAGLQTTILAKDPNRPNLVARLPGRGNAPGIVFHGHIDVVSSANQTWTHEPFEAALVDGMVWGRGSLDMKGGISMMVCAVLQAAAKGYTPAGDVVLAIMSDEEAGSDFGARFLTENHPEQFAGMKYAISEGGGDAKYLGSQRYYPLMVAEKQVCWLRTRFTGPSGHGSMPIPDGAMARLGHTLTTLNNRRLPVHITPVMEQMLPAWAGIAPVDLANAALALLNPAQTDDILDQMKADAVPQASSFDTLLHNTVCATVVTGGEKTNTIPGEVVLELDGRILPGYTSDNLIAELHTLLGSDLAFEIIRHDAGKLDVDMSLAPLLKGIVEELDPAGVVIPSMVGWFTDGRLFARLGIQNYGFLPLKLPPGTDFSATIHAADERLPVEALEFGVRALSTLLERYP